MAERRLDRTLITPEWLAKYNSIRRGKRIGVGALAQKVGVDRTTARRFINGAGKYFKSEMIAPYVDAIDPEEGDRIDLYREVGVRATFRGVLTLAWEGGFGTLGTHVDRMVDQIGSWRPEDYQLVGNIGLSRFYSIAVGVHALGAQNAANLPL